jgi:hypothetical protein
MQSCWIGTVIAASDDIVKVVVNAYFRTQALVKNCFQPPMPSHRLRLVGGGPSYDVVVNGKANLVASSYCGHR